MRESHKDTSWLVNPLEVVLNDGRQFEFRTSLTSDEENFIVRLFNAKTGEEYQHLRKQCKYSEQVNNYIDELLTEKVLHKLR